MSVNIVLTNQKGGVGKTSTAGTLAAGLVMRGSRVLSIDLDPQGNLGFSIGLETGSEATIYDVLQGEVSLKDAISKTDYGDIIPSDISLSASVQELRSDHKECILREALKTVADEYDYVIMDTPPALNILTINAYTASDYLIVPMSAEILSLVGLAQLKETIESVRATLNSRLKVLGILLTKYNKRTRLSREVREMAQSMAKTLGTELFSCEIRNGVAMSEIPAHGMSIFDYAPKSNPAKDYEEFIEEVLARIG